MSTYGFPDGQELTQWLGQPLEEATGKLIGAGSYVAGPFVLANFASVVVAVKAIGGNVQVKVTQSVSGGPASLQLVETVNVAAGGVLFEAFVLFGDSVTIEFDGSLGGTSIDYAIYPSNTTTNAQVITQATINVQQDEALVAAEPTIDFVTKGGISGTVVDDAANTRVKVTIPRITTSTIAGGPPAAPNDGDIWIATGVGADGARWTFQYDAAWVTDANKWKFIGGPAIGGVGLGAVTSGGFVALPTPAQVIAPRSGVYQAIWNSVYLQNTAQAVTHLALFSGGGQVQDAIAQNVTAGGDECVGGVNPSFVAVLGNAVDLRAAVSAGQSTFSFASLLLTPVRVQ